MNNDGENGMNEAFYRAFEMNKFRYIDMRDIFEFGSNWLMPY